MTSEKEILYPNAAYLCRLLQLMWIIRVVYMIFNKIKITKKIIVSRPAG